jgi:hypothetical protein
MASMQDPLVQQLIGQNPQAQAIQAALTAHIAEHVGFAYRNRMAAAMGMDLPEVESDVGLPPMAEKMLSQRMAAASAQVLAQSQAMVAQQQAQQNMQDPLLQIQMADLKIKASEVERKAKRDMADAAAKAFHNTDVGAGKFLSGGTDIIFDVSRDPINIIAKFGMAMRGGKLLKLDTAGAMQVKYPIMGLVPGAKNFIVERTGRLISAEASAVSEQMDAVRAGSGIFNKTARQYNRAIEDIANLARTSKTAEEAAGNIVTRYPTLGTEAAGHLSGMNTADDVHEFLKSVLYFGE